LQYSDKKPSDQASASCSTGSSIAWYRQSQSGIGILNQLDKLIPASHTDFQPKIKKKHSERGPKTLAFAPIGFASHKDLTYTYQHKMCSWAFLFISSFFLLSSLSYSGKAVLFGCVVPRVQEVCKLVSTISHFGVCPLLWTLKYFAYVFLLQ